MEVGPLTVHRTPWQQLLQFVFVGHDLLADDYTYKMVKRLLSQVSLHRLINDLIADVRLPEELVINFLGRLLGSQPWGPLVPRSDVGAGHCCVQTYKRRRRKMIDKHEPQHTWRCNHARLKRHSVNYCFVLLC